MKERPILFSGPMVRAILEGRKTQTRRIVKVNEAGQWVCHAVRSCLNPEESWQRDVMASECPYGKPVDRLWVREAWCHYDLWRPGPNGYGRICYRASGDEPIASFSNVKPDRWRPSIHMPRWASRITLEVVSVRVERLQDISAKDAIAEGCCDPTSSTPKRAFEWLWKSINGPGSWEANPWVWVVEFRKL